MKKAYRVTEGGMQHRFMLGRKKVQFIGGGFGNGKTAAVCVKALSICRDYPGANILLARSTYPKLNDTLRKEFLEWCPDKWVKRRPTKDDNTLYLTNGTVVNFRYVSQQGTKTEQSTSNLLSATYDLIVVDQIEDPEFQHKDFLDLIGRLRGGAKYIGNDPTMPVYGPRWMFLTSNPTRNWVYRELVRPIHRFYNEKHRIIDPKLVCEVDDAGKPIIVDKLPVPLIELFEGSTHENADNVGEDYIRTMLSTYKGVMQERFVMGAWGALSGLIYPAFDESIHVLEHTTVLQYLRELRRAGYKPNWIEGYDHGLVVQSCYLLGFSDDDGNLFILDGFYSREQSPAESARKITAIRHKYGADEELDNDIYADPDLFRRKAGNASSVGVTVAGIFAEDEHKIIMRRGTASIDAGIAKVTQYLARLPEHEHPITGQRGSPHLFISDTLDFVINEFSEYHWKRDTSSESIDKPQDVNDHAMDTIKYMLTDRPRIASYVGKPNTPPAFMSWHEIERAETRSLPRHR